MIHKFPFVDKDKKAEIMKWIDTQKHEAMSDAFKYEAAGNQAMVERSKYVASTFESIKVSIEYHMETEE